MKEKFLYYTLPFIIFTTLSLSILNFFDNTKTKDSIAVFAPKEDYHMIDADGDNTQDVLLVSFDEEDSANMTISLDDDLIDLTKVLGENVFSPFYVFVYDINLDSIPEILVYDVKADSKNSLYIVDKSTEDASSVLKLKCDFFGLLNTGGRKKIALIDDDKPYIINPLFNGSFVKSSFPALSNMVFEENYWSFVHNGMNNLDFLGAYFRMDINIEDYSYSPVRWHGVFKRIDETVDEWVVSIDDESISIVKE